MGLGLPELLIILVIVFLVFGAGKLPQVMGQLGKGVQSFKQGAGEATLPAVAPAKAVHKPTVQKVAVKKAMPKKAAVKKVVTKPKPKPTNKSKR